VDYGADLGVLSRHEELIEIGRGIEWALNDTSDAAGRRAVIRRVTGMAYRTAKHLLSIDPHDPLVAGLLLR
jgi:proline racemase